MIIFIYKDKDKDKDIMIKKFNNFLNEEIYEEEEVNDLESLTIQEFSMIREAMYSVRESDSPSAFQSKEFFKKQENFDIVVEKLRNLLTYIK